MADKSMTGDGAVVREWDGRTRFPIGSVQRVVKMRDEHNAAIRQQAAEIERLNDKLIEWQKEWYGWRKRLEASKTRNADLLKALEPFVELADSYVTAPDDDRTVINIGALRRVRDAMAAAKGETA